MKTLNLYFDFEFTSLSPDAQPISVGIVSDEVTETVYPSIRADSSLPYDEYIAQCERNIKGYEETVLSSKSFYAEFTDFDIERCDDWVKENVLTKINGYMTYQREVDNFDSSPFFANGGAHCFSPKEHDFTTAVGNTSQIKIWLKKWLEQFSDYQIQFVVDCGTYDFYWMVQLLAEWDMIEYGKANMMGYFPECKCGLPKLPANISPIPFDLNDLIAIKKGITPREAFDLDREKLANFNCDIKLKHISLHDANVIKKVYEIFNTSSRISAL